ncbi:hypothetical protein HDK90DRAFT_298738 [Phyllosticta capitalensis]|uniref:Uncharacterized protein n=1 Tax=Phyllosticta capitalensis TaxID=121624 RepID=A0ABR1YK73_9PEZI
MRWARRAARRLARNTLTAALNAPRTHGLTQELLPGQLSLWDRRLPTYTGVALQVEKFLLLTGLPAPCDDAGGGDACRNGRSTLGWPVITPPVPSKETCLSSTMHLQKFLSLCRRAAKSKKVKATLLGHDRCYQTLNYYTAIL